jgi:hypothetical protein
MLAILGKRTNAFKDIGSRLYLFLQLGIDYRLLFTT